MAYTMSALVASLRIALQDKQQPYLFADELLQQAIVEAVGRHSFQFPNPVVVLATVAANQTAVPLYPLGAAGAMDPAAPSDIIAVQRVELPIGTPLPEDPWPATDPARSRGT